MSFRINTKGKIIESPLPTIDKKTLKRMESKIIVSNPLLNGIKDKKVLVKAIQLELQLSAYSLSALKANKKFLLGNPIDFHDKDTKRAEIEKSLLELTVKQALKRNTKWYKVKDKSNEITENLAFFAISVGNISVNDKKIPSVVLDYFILNNKFRNYKCDPDKYTLSIELFREILSIINELSNQIGIRYIILEPLRKEEKLVKFYKEFGFDFIPKNINWMYLDIQQLN